MRSLFRSFVGPVLFGAYCCLLFACPTASFEICGKTAVGSTALVSNASFALHVAPSECDVKCQEVLAGIHSYRLSMNSRHYHSAVARFIDSTQRVPPNGVIVEIGTCMGGNAIGMARITKHRDVSVIAVDPFLADYDSNDGTSVLYQKLSKTYGTQPHEFAKLWSDAMTWDINHSLGLCNYGLINELSTTAARFFKDGSVDFLFVDGLHTYDGVMNDLISWYPKIKSGGVIMFNDYGCRSMKCAFEGVTRAADTFLKSKGLSIKKVLTGNNGWTVKA
ncbi:hypothetical protein B484DRAFT_215271 [Ochromonadaceae sp. CCMP2298]|nr:hypothetical protein B484DRAFT_215271 [Ochromonadaceae sp. CCMP2298]